MLGSLLQLVYAATFRDSLAGYSSRTVGAWVVEQPFHPYAPGYKFAFPQDDLRGGADLYGLATRVGMAHTGTRVLH